MISVTVDIHDGEYRRVLCFGHAEYADTDDIVCAAVSVLVLNTVNCIEKFTDDPISYGADQERGMIDFQFEGEVSHDSHLLIASMITGIEQIADNYGETYVSLTTQEV